MAQEQPRRGAEPEQEPIRYGDIFAVSGELAKEAVAPRDAAAMQSAESQMTGKMQKGGPAAVMQSAATKNVEVGLVARGAAFDVAKNEGAASEAVGDQVVCFANNNSK